MKIRVKLTGQVGYACELDPRNVGKIIVGFKDDGGQASVDITACDVLLVSGEWKDMQTAFHDRDILPNSGYTRFGPPVSADNKDRGYND